MLDDILRIICVSDGIYLTQGHRADRWESHYHWEGYHRSDIRYKHTVIVRVTDNTGLSLINVVSNECVISDMNNYVKKILSLPCLK